MNYVTLYFTKDIWNIFSWIVRWTLPHSRFKLAESSHCYIAVGEDDLLYEAIAIAGVRRTLLEDVMATDKIVRVLKFPVPNIEEASIFLENQLGKKYDYKGVIGLALNPSRRWEEDDCWFCYELAAATLKAGGLDIFTNISHVTEASFFSIKIQ